MEFLLSWQIQQVFHHAELLEERQGDKKLSRAWRTWSGISFNDKDLNYVLFIFYFLSPAWNVNIDCFPYMEKK
jgi:hypothetical protein